MRKYKVEVWYRICERHRVCSEVVKANNAAFAIASVLTGIGRDWDGARMSIGKVHAERCVMNVPCVSTDSPGSIGE